MAAPNILSVSSILGKTAYLTPTTTSASVLLSNAASSGKVMKINTITAANFDTATTRTTTVAINTIANGSGNSFPIVSTVDIPADASLVVSDKNTAFFLEENKSIVVTSATANTITYIVSYEELS